MITLDYSTSYRSVTHTQAYFSSLHTDIVSIADLKPITKEPTIHLVDENGNPYTVQGSVTFYGHFNGGVDSYVPTSQYVYRVDGTLGIGIRLNYHAPEFPDINDYVADSYSSIAAYSAAALNWGKAVENWYASVEAGEITEAAIGDTGGIVASVKSDTPIKIGNLIQALDASALKIVGSAFDDVIEGRGSQSNEIDGGAGKDAITVLSNGSNNIKGGTGDDTIVITGSGISTIDAGDGNDTISGGSGDYHIALGSGTDSVTINGSGTSTVTAGTATGSLSISGGGTLIVKGNLIGGTATIGAAGSTLELTGSYSGKIDFLGTGGTLQIGGTTMPTGAITGLTGSKIELELVSLLSLNGKSAEWSGNQLSISSPGGLNSFNLAGSQSKDLAFFTTAEGHTQFTTANFGVDGTEEAGIVFEATEALLRAIVAIKSYQRGSLALKQFDDVFGPFFNSVGLALSASEVKEIQDKFKAALDSPTATDEEIKNAWHESFSESVQVVVKEGLKVVLEAAAAAAAQAATTAALAGLAGFAAEGAVGGYLSALAIGGGILSAPVVVGIGTAVAVGIAVDKYYDPVLKPIVSGWIEEQLLPAFESIFLDGYISGATVFSDDNGNGQLDPIEASTTTDSTGNFSLLTANGPLVAFGGVDTSTGLQFKGQMSAPEGSTVITPLTALLTLLASDAAAEQKVLSSFGLSSSIDLNTFDPIAATQAGNADGPATMAAVAQVYDTVSLIASTLVAAGGEFLSGVKAAFAAIAVAIGGSVISLTDEAQVGALVSATAQSEGLFLGQGVADNVAAIIVASNTLLDQKAQSGATGDALLNAIAAIERVAQGTASNAIQQAGNDSDQLQDLVNAFTGENLDNAVSVALEHLGVSDTTAPAITPVAVQTNEANSAAGATIIFAATASDDVDGALPVVFKEGNTVVHSGDVFSFGTHTITATAVDAAGNQTSQSFKFNVVDTTAPTLTPVANQTKEATSAAGAAAFFAVTASDLVDGTAPVVFKEGNTVVHSGDIFGLGSHTIIASTTDAAGNLASETFTINVRDTTAPTLTPIADQTLQATTAAGAAAFFTTTASDLVDGTDPVVYKEGNKVVNSGDIFGVGVHTITATAVDAAGNSATDIFEINVLGVTSNNHNPVAIDDSKGVAKGKSLSVSAKKGVLANDRDADHDHLSVGSVNGSAANVGHAIKGDYGTLTLNADGSYSYAATAKALPSKIFVQDTFTYTTVDGHGGSDTATLTFSVFDPSFDYKAGSNTILRDGNGKSVLDGSAGHVLAYGGNGADVLIGGNCDILVGGKGPDQFVFRADFGKNTILDFDVKNDHLQFDDSTFNSVKSILDHTTNTALGALISDGHGDSVLLMGVTKAQLVAYSSDLIIA